AWLDCDIIFDNDNWIEETSKLLEEYVVVQPFSFVVRMPKGGISKNIYSLDFGDKENKKMYGMGYGINNFGKSVINDFLKHGHTGFAWTARKEIFNEINIYDKLMLGSGDLFMAQSFYGNKKNHVYDLSSNMMQLDQGEWLKFIYEVVNESVYYTPGFIFHLWHGDKSNRLHDERFEILRKYDFDPNRDIKLGMSGIWEWVTDKPELHSKVKDYFYKRVEE
ncbi:MAG: hypothetical protein KJ674_05510, partial [Nanoarchaeota archaeon]|nr:hypothetical protein [Nanoarchaeota archaeon]